MSNLTFTQYESYVRAYAGELDSQGITQGELAIWGTLAQRRVQQDLLGLGIKHFTKRLVSDGTIVSLPSDLSNIPNSIISIKSAIGDFTTSIRAFASTAFGTANAEFTVTAIEPGTGGNGGILMLKDIGDPGAPALGTVRYEGVTPFDFDVWVDGGTTTATQLIAYLEAYKPFNEFMTIALQSGNTGAGAVTTDVTLTLEGGAGTGWKPAREITIEEYHRAAQSGTVNTYKAPSSAEPAYCIEGDTSGTRLIRLLPNSPPASSIRSSLITYKYRVADLTTTGSLSIPEEFEELVLADVLIKMFDKLEKFDKKAIWENNYNLYLNNFKKNYTEQRQSQVAEKTRLQSADPSN